MKFNFHFKPSINLDKLREDMPRRLLNLQRAIGQALAEQTSKEVKKRVPANEDWLKLYRDSIQYWESEDGKSWAVAGIAPTNISTHDASTSLVKVTSDSAAGAILNAFNGGEWPIDLLPAYKYQEAAVVRLNLAESTVSDARAKLAPLVENVMEALDSNRVPKSNSGQPKFTSGEYFDLRFMANALEVGAPGHPRVKHWGPAKAKLISNHINWAKNNQVKINSAMAGNDIESVDKIGEAQMSKLRDIRESTWP